VGGTVVGSAVAAGWHAARTKLARSKRVSKGNSFFMFDFSPYRDTKLGYEIEKVDCGN
jgi:hypothetical protein